MRFLVMGAGAMGRAVAYDLVRSKGVKALTLADSDAGRLEEAKALADSGKAATKPLDVTDREAVVAIMEGHDVAVSCVPYRFNVDLTKAAIEAGCHLNDLGGNNDIVRKQLCLDNKARKADVTIIPDCGLAPGMATVLVADAIKRLDKVEAVHMRVGGLPMNPRPPLEYMILFNPAGLVNEYKEMPVVIRHGNVLRAEPMEDLEEIEFPEPFGTLEAFNTSGGTSTLPQTLLGKVQTLDYKTIRYPGHRDKMKALMDLGFFDEDPVDAGGIKVAPRDVTEALLLDKLSYEDDDVVLLRVWADGMLEGQERTVTYTVIDHRDSGTGLTAMQRTTAFPASIVAHMMATGEIDERGVVTQEQVVPTVRFLEELEKRSIDVDIERI
jgi:lysine 6-dehydrogenase